MALDLSSDIVALAALMLSIASFVYSVYNGRRLYRASLQPIVDVTYSMHYTPGSVSGQALPPKPSLAVRNTGKGTARYLRPFGAHCRKGVWSTIEFGMEMEALEAGRSESWDLSFMEPADDAVMIVSFKDVLDRWLHSLARFTFDPENKDWWLVGDSETLSSGWRAYRRLRRWIGKDPASQLMSIVKRVERDRATGWTWP